MSPKVPRFGRRNMLQLSAMASLAHAVGCDELTSKKAKPLGSVGPTSTERSAEVIVIGAGMAGLSAAKVLSDAGKRVIVLEGRDRAGGRVWTDRSLGSPFDLGASWIHGVKRNPLTKLADQHGVKTAPSSYDDVRLFDHDGSKVSDSSAAEIALEWEALLGEVEKNAESLSGDTSVGAAVRAALAGEKLTSEEQRMLDWVTSTVEVAQGEDLDKVSLLAGDDDEGFSGADRLFPEGYDQLIRAQGAGLDVRFSEKVRRVVHRSKGDKGASDAKAVTVHTTTGKLEADRVLVTVPLGVLKRGSIQFSPALTAKKMSAIGRLGMGVINKVVMVFDKTFWPTDRDFIGYMSKQKRAFPVYLNCRKFSDVHALVAFTGGSFARSLESQKSEQVVANAFAPLKKMFGDKIPKPKQHLVARWSSDPFAFGSYSHLRVGARAKDFEVLQEPVGERLFFAGEHTIRKHPGTVHGALLSGIREAKRILAL